MLEGGGKGCGRETIGFSELLAKLLAHPHPRKCFCGVLYVHAKAMEKFRNLGINKVLGVLMFANYILGFLLLLCFIFPSIIDCLWDGGFAAALAYSKAPVNSSHWQIELVIANIDTGWACAHGLSYVNTTALLVTALTPCFLWKWLTRLSSQEVFHSLGILILTWIADRL